MPISTVLKNSNLITKFPDWIKYNTASKKDKISNQKMRFFVFFYVLRIIKNKSIKKS